HRGFRPARDPWPPVAAARRFSRGRSLMNQNLAMLFDKFAQSWTELREIIFPAENALANWELGIVARDLLFQIHAHARHQLQVARDGAAHGVANGVRLRIERAQ